MWTFFSKGHRRRRLIEQPLSDDWRAILSRNVPLYGRLSAAERTRVDAVIKVMVSERRFVGLRGFVITDEVRVTIASQAALLLLAEDGYYFDRVPTIYVQPRYHRTRMTYPLGGAELVEEGVLAEGQSLEQGEIRLAWNEVLYGGRDPHDGENVVLHELAHHLDSLDGEIDGVPPLSSSPERQKWAEVFGRELAALRGDMAAGRTPFLHAEAALNQAELFAYTTECYFEQPWELAELHADLFDCLFRFYKVDPRLWAESNQAD